MKKILMAAIAAGVATYLLNRKKTPVPESNGNVHESHHLTTVFSNAKKHAMSH